MRQQLKHCKTLVDERINFARHLNEVGFNKLEGTKWSKRVATDQLKASCVYLCWDDLLAECKMNPQRAERHKQQALADGQGLGALLDQICSSQLGLCTRACDQKAFVCDACCH